MVGEALVSFAAEAILSKLVSTITGEISLASNSKEDVKNLSDKSTMILALLRDAERHQVKEESVILWLEKLMNAVYDVDDVLDELAFEMIRRKLEIQNRKENRAQNFFSVSNPPIAFRLKMTHRVKDINVALDRVLEDGIKLGLNQALQRAMDPLRTITDHGDFLQTHPFVDDSKVMGREADKSKLVCMLLQSEGKQDLSVVAIVGLAGVGKTSLAQLIYKDESVTSHFSKKIWICVSDDFHVARLLKEIAEFLRVDIGATSNVEAIIQKLKDKLYGDKYLLVLDDVWNTNAEKWEAFRNSLLGICASKESKILVTTRSVEVVLTMQTPLTHQLTELSEEDSWLLFRQRAYSYEGAKETPNLVDIGKRMVKRCGGVPLALKTLGALMHSKKEDDWSSIEESNLWDLYDGESGMLPALRLSFNQLPPRLKQCFTYCSIFPKNFKFEKDNLIQLWIAQGFIQPPQGSNLVMEDIGDNYFKSLLWISFFQDVEINIYGNVRRFKMHDVVHDLAQYLSRSDVLTLDGNKKNDNIKVRHISALEIKGTVPTVLKENAMKLRTLFLADDACSSFLMSLNCLRVLKLEGSSIKEMPTIIGKLKHLRYLDVSETQIEIFPASIAQLYHLQTLRLGDVQHSLKLLNRISNLIDLRHLYFKSESKHWRYDVLMPFEMGRLTCLQTLSFFVVGQEKGRQIEELGSLNKLRGKLEIYNLEYVRGRNEAKRANLAGKTNVYKLKLAWDHGSESGNNDEDVLEGLQPPPNLKCLTIEGFRGSKFSQWMMMANVNSNNANSLLPQNLVKIQLISCQKCEQIPTLGELPFLRFLTIYGMHNVKCIGPKFYSYTNSSYECEVSSSSGSDIKRLTLFPALEVFTLKRMYKLVEWTEVAAAAEGKVVVFPCLEELSIDDCEQLTTAPTHFPFLKRLSMKCIKSGVPIRGISSKLTALAFLTIRQAFELTHLPKEVLQNYKNLISLCIGECWSLGSISSVGLCNLRSLEDLSIYSCTNLVSIPSIQGLTSLCTLKIAWCDKITGLPIGLGSCTSLKYLTVQNCPNLVTIPVEDLRELKCLSSLSITYCQKLKSLLLDGFIHCLARLENLEIGPLWEELDSFPFDLNADDLSQQKQQLQHLKSLTLNGWPNLKSLPEQLQHLTALQYFYIREFNGVKTLPEWLGDLSSLQELHVLKCKNLKVLPSEEAIRRLTNLQLLEIQNCPTWNGKWPGSGPIYYTF